MEAVENMKKTIKRLFCAGICLLFGCFLLLGIDAEATGENGHFGSAAYDWTLDKAWSIGVYAASEQNIVSAEMSVEYDAKMLEYHSGGTLEKEGLVKVSVTNVGAKEHKEMLQFVPKYSGDTQVTIKDIRIRNVAGEEVSPEAVSVPVKIQGDRMLPPEETEPEEQPEEKLEEGEAEQPAEPVQSEATVIMEKNDRSTMVNRILIGILIVMLIVILAMLLVIKWQIVQRNKRREQRLCAQEIRIERPNGSDLNGYEKEEESQEELQKANSASSVYEDERFADEELEIAVQHVTMEFKREKDEATSIKELLIRTMKKQRSYEMFKALDDISFNIRKGEVVGIIGTNGAGKSTILKIISGALAPTSGKVDVDKNKVQLLTLGTGFDFELTGRENVYLNGAIIGYSKEYIDEKYDDIVKFAELEGFMEEKVRNYSSGMVSRLGFAIATARETPEILILDEVLSVGDRLFKEKSLKRVKEMIHGGSTVVMVSHSTATIRDNCTKVVWIEKGHLIAQGDVKEICEMYDKYDGDLSTVWEEKKWK